MEPFFTNDAIVLGLLLVVLAIVFKTSSSQASGWKRFYRVVPALLLCYFLPALLHYPFGLIAPEWFTPDLLGFLQGKGIDINLADLNRMSFEDIKKFMTDQHGIDEKEYKAFIKGSSLYFVSSRYLLPASLVLLCLSIDIKGLMNLGPKALIMFFAATIGIVIGGPIALFLVLNIAPGIIEASPEEVYRGLSTVAGSWIGGGANQTAMKEIYEVGDNLFATMIIVDVVVANIWMGFLLYGANISEKLDRRLKADTSAIEDLKNRIQEYRSSIEKIPNMTDVFTLLAVGFGAVAISHWWGGAVRDWMENFAPFLKAWRLHSLLSSFFWLVIFATTIGLILSFTEARKLEGIGASRMGSVFIYILVATIGMKMNLGEVYKNLGLFAIGIVWMLVHVGILLAVAKIIRAPFFFVAVGSQANVGGAASAPIVASAFNPALAPVGVIMAVLGYALGTYFAIVSAELMGWIAL